MQPYFNQQRISIIGYPPCKGCTPETGRSETCHVKGNCKKFDEWKAKNDAAREKELAKKQSNRQLNDFRGEAIRKVTKGKK